MASTLSASSQVSYGNMRISIDVVGTHGSPTVGTLEAVINFMTDSPEKKHIYPDVVFTPIDNQPLTQSQAERVIDLMMSLDLLRRQIGIKAGHRTLHTKAVEDYLRD